MRVAVVGLGRMGSALARRLLDGGVDVAVWNRSPGPVATLVDGGATALRSLGEAWPGADAVLTFLADDAAVRAVVLGDDGLVAQAPSDGLLVEMSTISVVCSAEVARAAARAGAGYLRCPVSGNPDVLTAGNLMLMASGPRATFEAAEALLERIGSTVRYLGPGDEARTMKLAVNALLATTAEALAESVLLCEASGIDRGLALEVIGRSAVGSPFVAYKREALEAREYEATFTVAMLGKDLDLVRAAAEAIGVQLPVARLVGELTAATVGDGLGDLDLLALLPHLQALAGRPTDVPVAGT